MSRNKFHRKKVKLLNLSGDAHFSTFSCFHRLPLLSRDRTCRWFVDALAAARLKHSFDLWAWVIMPEHVYLLFYPRLSDYETSSILGDIKQPVGEKAIRYLENISSPFLDKLTVVNKNRTYRHFWQCGPGYDENIRDPAAIHDIIEYIHQNPVRRGLVEKAEDWIWSSARDWAGLDSPFIQVDRTVPPLEIIGDRVVRDSD